MLRVKYYIRYVDDFVIFDADKTKLSLYKRLIWGFLKTIMLELHPDKSKIRILSRGVCFLGFRVFYQKLLKKSNIRKMRRKLLEFMELFERGKMSYDRVYASIDGWLAYASHGNTYGLKKDFVNVFEAYFRGSIADTEINWWLNSVKNKPEVANCLLP